MCKIIAIANQKGGVGKTTTTSNLGIGLAKQGKRVLLIDADAQGSLTACLGFQEPDKLEITLATVMARIINDEEIKADYGVLKHEEGISFMPGNIELSGLEVSLVNTMSRELVMRSYVGSIKENYDYILIDCMPSLGMITINAFACADSILIPVQAAYLPVKGLEQLIKTIGKVKRQINPRLAIEGILLTMVDSRTNYARDISALLRESYGNTPTVIGEYAGFKMAVSFDSFNHKFVMNVKGQLSHNLEIGSDPLGNITRINNALESMPRQLEEAQTKLATVEHQLETAKVEVTKPFAQEAELAEKLDRLSALNALLNMDEKGDNAIGMDDDTPDVKIADKPAARVSLKERLAEMKVKVAGNQVEKPVVKEKGKEETL